jgi:hypothetical protein
MVRLSNLDETRSSSTAAQQRQQQQQPTASSEQPTASSQQPAATHPWCGHQHLLHRSSRQKALLQQAEDDHKRPQLKLPLLGLVLEAQIQF